MRCFAFFLGLSILPLFSFAQRHDTRERASLGLKAGFNSTNVYDAEGEAFHSNRKMGFAGGMFLSLPINRYFGLQPEILFSQKGSKTSGSFLGSSYEMKRTSNYLDVPLFVSFKPIPFITFLAGPYYAYLLGQTNTFTNGATSIQQEIEFDNENARRHVIGFSTGIDVNIRHLVLGFRVGWDVLNSSNDRSATTPRYKNTMAQFTLGYRFYR